MPHDESVMDPEWHISIVGKTGKNQPFKKAHVPIDPSKQQVCIWSILMIGQDCSNIIMS